MNSANTFEYRVIFYSYTDSKFLNKSWRWGDYIGFVKVVIFSLQLEWNVWALTPYVITKGCWKRAFH